MLYTCTYTANVLRTEGGALYTPTYTACLINETGWLQSRAVIR
jgi:hypothetical protein